MPTQQNHPEAEAVWAENETYIRKICAYKLSSHPHEIEDAVQETALAYFDAVQKGIQIREPKKMADGGRVQYHQGLLSKALRGNAPPCAGGR